ncbi:MAG: SGNH/GDSL hydrolase family protein [Patescibacteria group bacterium]
MLPVLAAAETESELMKINKFSTVSARSGKVTTVVKIPSAGTTTTTTAATIFKQGFSGSVTIRAQGGATLQMILANLKANQTPQNHADVWIIEGGINDIKWFSGANDPPGFWTEYSYYLNQFTIYAETCGVKLYFQEMTPVVAEVINQWPYWLGLDVPGKLPRMNTKIHDRAETSGNGVIYVYDAFSPYWKDWNSGDSSVHPNDLGAEKLAEAWANGIRKDLAKDSTIYVGGDSIAARVSLGVFYNKLIALFPNAVDAETWNEYE